MRLFYLLCFFLLLSSGHLAVQAQVPPQAQTVPGRLVFKLKAVHKPLATGNTIKLDKLQAALTALQATSLEQKFPRTIFPKDVPGATDLTLVYQIKLPEDQDLEKARALLLQTGLLEYAETVRNYQPLYMPNDPQADSVSGGQYYLKNIKAYRAWDFEKGDTNIVIGILDMGVKFSHKDLARNIKYNYADPIDGIDNDNDGYIDNFRGWDVAENNNNPANYPFGDHGVLVAGIASASADNNHGLAGVGFKCKFLPIKVYPNTTSGHHAQYEGIVYAADHGCHVINLSWGGEAPFSFFEQDVINYAVINRNAVVVAAAGNTIGKFDFYPAGYQNVLAVATLNSANEISNQTTHSYKVDLSAPGINILTTYVNHDSSYIAVSGSSFAAPMVSGAAGLVKSKFPLYNAHQIMEQLRVTADASIYGLPGNANFQGQLGSGLLNVAKAVTTTNAKSVRFTEVVNSRGAYTSAGDTLDLTATFKNFLQPLTNLAVTVTSASPNATVLHGTFNAGAMATLASKSNTVPFQIKLAANTPVNEKILLRFDFTDGTYTDYQYYELIVHPDFITIDVNKVDVTVTSTGRLGFYNYLNPDLGLGVRYKNLNLLADGSFLAGTSATTVSDNIFKDRYKLKSDFFSQTRAHYVNNLPHVDMEAQGMLQDSFPASGMVGIQVQYKAYAWQNAPNDRFVILEYILKNITPATLTNLYAGIYADWDITGGSRNVADWDAANRLGHVHNVQFDSIYAGVKLLTSGLPSYYAIDVRNAPAGTINIWDGFSDAEKYQALSGGIGRASAGNPLFGNNVAHIVGTAVPDLPPNQSARVAFAILAADNLTDLQTVAQAAQIKFNDRILSRPQEMPKEQVRIYPNPASGTVKIELPAAGAGAVQVEMLNAIGKTVAVQTGKPGETLHLNTEKLAAGLYMVKVKSNSGTVVKKVQVVK